MRVIQVLNNNVVLADDSGTTVIATGRGLGFRLQPGDPIAREDIQRVFVPRGDDDTQALAQLLADIPANHLMLADCVLTRLAAEGHRPAAVARASASATIALADHVSFAISRVREGIAMTYPLRSEIEHLYPEELAAADRFVVLASSAISDIDLPAQEAVPLALHLVNAAFTSGDLSETMRMTEVITQIFDVVEQFYGRRLERDSLTVARFAAHLRYFFVRAEQGRQLDDDSDAMARLIVDAYPEAYRCAQHVCTMLQVRLGTHITPAEVAYLTLHIQRFAAPQREAAQAAREAAKRRGMGGAGQTPSH